MRSQVALVQKTDTKLLVPTVAGKPSSSGLYRQLHELAATGEVRS
jgi:hypothetical protein